MATQIEQRPPIEGPPPSAGASAAVAPPAYPPPAGYPQPQPQPPAAGYPPYPPYPGYPAYGSPYEAAAEAERTQQRWLGRCLALVIVSLGLFIPLLGIALGAAQQFAVGFGGFLLAAAIPAALLAVVDVAFIVGTRPRR